MAVEVFPVVLSGSPTPAETNARGARCSPRVWWRDWHAATRRTADGTVVRHDAQDIFAPSGSLVLAPETAEVIGSSADTGPTPRGGHWLRLMTDDRVYFLSHLHEPPLVKAGDIVEAGQHIALVGRTGNAASTCPHLHIGARKRVGRTQRGGAAINLHAELLRAHTGPTSPPPTAAGANQASPTTEAA